MKFNSFNVTALNKIKNTKLVKRGAALVMAGVTLITFSSCSKESKKNAQNESSSIVTEINNEYIGDEKTTNDAQLPSFYNSFNIFENSDINKKYGVAYIKLADERASLIERILKLDMVSVEEVKMALDSLESNPELSEEVYGDIKNAHMEILSFDKSSLLSEVIDGNSNAYGLIQLKDDEGYLFVFNKITLKSDPNANYIIAYSNDDKKIITYNKLTGDLIVIENSVYLGCDNETITFAACEDKENIHRYDIKNKSDTKEKVDDLTIQVNYVSYKTADNKFNAVDLLNTQSYINCLDQENFWIKLSDRSIVYVTKNGEQKRYQKFYKLLDGDFDKEYCVLSGLSTYPDEKGNFSCSNDSFYFNKKLDSVYKVPYYSEMLENNVSDGYMKYHESYGSNLFVDLTTGKRYYLKDTILSNDYTIYNVGGAADDSNSRDCAIFKDKEGNTVSEVKVGSGYIQKYFDEEKIAIQCYWTNDDKTAYYYPTIVDLSDLNNPEVILTSFKPNIFHLFDTPISTIFKVYWENEHKYSLMDVKGNQLTEKVDSIDFEIYEDNDEIVYATTLGEFREKGEIEYTSISFDKNGKTIDEMSSHKLIKQK